MVYVDLYICKCKIIIDGLILQNGFFWSPMLILWRQELE